MEVQNRCRRLTHFIVKASSHTRKPAGSRTRTAAQPSSAIKMANGCKPSVLQSSLGALTTVETICYSKFEELVAQGTVTKVTIGADTIEGKLKAPLPSGKSAFITNRVDAALSEKLAAKRITVTGATSGGLSGILSWILPFMLLFGLWSLLGSGMGSRQGMGGLMAIGKSRAKVYVEQDTKDVCRCCRRRRG
jgi:cell division protease FtsH